MCMHALRLTGVLFAFLVITACGLAESEEIGSGEAQSDGLIAKRNGKVVRLSNEKAAEFCKDNFCEPNYVYRASFAIGQQPLADSHLQKGPPIPRQPAQPIAPTPVDGGIPESHDYSRAIMNMTEAWEIMEGSHDIVVAVIDTGVQINHPDLANNIWTNEVERLGVAGVDDDNNGYIDDIYGYDFVNDSPDMIDDESHGTHCAGIIGAVRNTIGIVGVAPRVKIMPIKFLSASGSGTTEAAIHSINYAVDNGADIISNSWGGKGESELMDEAIQRAHNAGILVVAAAGNDSSDNDELPVYPANYDNVLAVASTNEDDEISFFSNFGLNTVRIAAPGSHIFSTIPGSVWAKKSGTSMAAPQVAGALALGKALRENLSVDQYKNLLCDSSNKILLDQVECGRMDVYSFLRAVESARPQAQFLTNH